MSQFQITIRQLLTRLGLSFFVVVLVGIGLQLSLEGRAATGINKQLNYQGKMTASTGTAVSNSSWNFRFRIYSASSGGSLLWTERWVSTTTQVSTVGGVFSVALGSLGQANQLADLDWNSDSLYLQVDLDADGNGSFEESFSTRKRLTSVPYAFNTDEVDGLHATSTAAVANYLVALDANATLNLYGEGVSSTYATSTWLYVGGGATITQATTSRLFVSGEANFAGDIGVAGDIFMYNQTTNEIKFRDRSIELKPSTGNENFFEADGAGSQYENIFNQDGADIDLRVESDAYDYALFLDASTGYFGIATNSPAYLLQTGSVAAGTYFSVDSSGSATTSNHFSADSTLYVKDSKVGIGTQSPVDILHVYGNSAVASYVKSENINAGGLAGFVAQNDNATDIEAVFGIGGTSYTNTVYQDRAFLLSSTLADGISLITQGSGDDIRFYTGGDATTNERLRIDGDGYVGIGTTAPQARLHIAGTTTFNLSDNLVQGLVSNVSNIRSAMFMEHQASGNQMGSIYLGTGFRIDPAGTTFPTVYRTNASIRPSILQINHSGLHYFLDSASTVGSYTPTERLTVNTSGNLGIGDTSPLSLFTVGSGDKFQIDSSGNATSSGWFNIGSTDVGALGALVGNGDLYVGDDATITDSLYVGGPTVMIGKVGIGTTTPQYQLVVQQSNNTLAPLLHLKNSGGAGGSADSAILFESGTGGYYSIGRSNNDGYFYIANGADLNTNTRLTINDSGNLGIGDTSPLSLFTVGSGDKFRIDSSGNATSSGWFNIGSTDVGALGALVGNGDLYVGDDATITDRLNVSGTLKVGGTSVQAGDAAAFYAVGASSGVASGGISLKHSTEGSTWRMEIGGSSNTYNGGLWLSDGSTRRFILDSSGNAVVPSGYATSTAGLFTQNNLHIGGSSTFDSNVGIGDTSPAYLLTVGSGELFSVDTSGNTTSTGQLNVGAGGVGDSLVEFMINGVSKWSIGADDSDSDNFVISASGTLGTSNAMRLDSSGNATVTNRLTAVGIYNETTASAANVFVDSTGKLFRSTSSRKYKTDINYEGVNGDLVYKLQPASYKEKNSGVEYIGFVAEDVAEIEPRLVLYDDEGKPDALHYGLFTALIVEGMKDLKMEVDDLKVATNTKSATSTQEVIVINNPDVDIQTLVVQQAATFYGTLYVQGEAKFLHKVVFEKDLEVKGKIYAAADQAGTATILAGATSTEIIFNSAYEVAPKITATARRPFALGIEQISANGFRVFVADPLTESLSFDWIALAVKGSGAKPVITDFSQNLTAVGFDTPVELWVQVSDPDTTNEELTYTWEVSPNIGSIDGSSGLVFFTIPSGSNVQTGDQITIQVTVSDGTYSVTDSKTINVLVADESGNNVVVEPSPEEPEPIEEEGGDEPELVIIYGCTDQTATNYNDTATDDDGSCEYPEEEVVTEVEPEPVVVEGESPVGGPEI